MAEYFESQYRFTNPIRYFKSNDPIYYEVENIPLKQLQENDLWLKDQITSTEDRLTSFKTDVDRSNFTELKPYCDGGSNIVKVKPGRFTARINDAYNITPLQFITGISGGDQNISASSNYNVWTAKASSDSKISTIINKFKEQNIMSDALNMNGLVERAFSYPSRIPDRASQFLVSSSPVINSVDGAFSVKQPPYPLTQVQLWSNFSERGPNGYITEFEIRQYDSDNANIGFASLGSAESEFIKKWRGVARTSVVDIPEELSIEVPKFDSNDFYFTDDSGQKVILTQAAQRIDLLFIYSKPVDSSAATVAKFDSTGKPTVLTKAQLGLVRGAGVGVDFQSFTSKIKSLKSGIVTNDGSLKILPHISDQIGVNNGFKVSGIEIKGSFPSPDDLMNLTPILDEELTTDHYGLIGQSILPIAYIVVKKNATLSDGSNLITNSDIIDIRPFFRTTELSYNERAGIAAAVPAPSLANPVVTQAELDYEIRKVYAAINPAGTTGGGTTTNSTLLTQPRPIAAGIIQGGFFYGVEGAIGKAMLTDTPNKAISVIKSDIQNIYNYPTSVANLPDWDVAKWCDSNIVDRGQYPNDRINFYRYLSKYTTANPTLEFAALEERPINLSESNWNTTQAIKRFGTEEVSFNVAGGGTIFPGQSYLFGTAVTTDGFITIYFVKKTIKLTGLAAIGATNYSVNAKFLNCVPLSQNSISTNTSIINSGKTHGIWVEKHRGAVNSEDTYFTIYAAWAAKEHTPTDPIAAITNSNYIRTPKNNRTGNHFAGFAVINNLVSLGNTRGNRNSSYSTAEAAVGAAIYPTVEFEVIGYPNGWSGFNTGVNFNSLTEIPAITVV